jgi:hypothetical protein
MVLQSLRCLRDQTLRTGRCVKEPYGENRTKVGGLLHNLPGEIRRCLSAQLAIFARPCGLFSIIGSAANHTPRCSRRRFDRGANGGLIYREIRVVRICRPPVTPDN